jgi:hypothetical protein
MKWNFNSDRRRTEWMNDRRRLLILIVVCGSLTLAITSRGNVRQDRPPDVVPLIVPMYPHARGSVVTPRGLTPGVLSGTNTTFTTTDQPAVLRDWYMTTLQRLGWTADGSSASTQESSVFTDQRGCPISRAQIAWNALVKGRTSVTVAYSTYACIGPYERPHDVVPLTVPLYPNARIKSEVPLRSTALGFIVGSRITFKTADSPAVVHDWYKTTLYGMGWEGDESTNMTGDPNRHYFSDNRGCPHADALIDWEEPVNGMTTVVVEYKVANCRR